MRSILLTLAVTLFLKADDTGVPPRTRPSDYPAHQSTKDATLAATILPAHQIERVFSAEIARHYIVLEVAIYPQNGQTINIGLLDFGLKLGDTMTYAEKPRDVATPWPEKNTTPAKPVTVVTETGVIYSRTTDPVNGRRSGWGTYEGVGVTNDPRAATPPPPRQDPDPRMLEQRVREMMLPEGQAKDAVAGYLFFPQYKSKRHKSDTTELQWSPKETASVILRLPEK